MTVGILMRCGFEESGTFYARIILKFNQKFNSEVNLNFQFNFFRKHSVCNPHLKKVLQTLRFGLAINFRLAENNLPFSILNV